MWRHGQLRALTDEWCDCLYHVPLWYSKDRKCLPCWHIVLISHMAQGFWEGRLSLIGFYWSLSLYGWRLERLSCSYVSVNLVEMRLKRPGPCDPGPVAEAWWRGFMMLLCVEWQEGGMACQAHKGSRSVDPISYITPHPDSIWRIIL